MKKQSLEGKIAFWHYDMFPFVLHAEIIKDDFEKDSWYENHVQLKGYGYLEKSKLLFVLPLKKGSEVICDLYKLKVERADLTRLVEKMFKSQLDSLVENAKKNNII